MWQFTGRRNQKPSTKEISTLCIHPNNEGDVKEHEGGLYKSKDVLADDYKVSDNDIRNNKNRSPPGCVANNYPLLKKLRLDLVFLKSP